MQNDSVAPPLEVSRPVEPPCSSVLKPADFPAPGGSPEQAADDAEALWHFWGQKAVALASEAYRLKQEAIDCWRRSAEYRAQVPAARIAELDAARLAKARAS